MPELRKNKEFKAAVTNRRLTIEKRYKEIDCDGTDPF